MTATPTQAAASTTPRASTFAILVADKLNDEGLEYIRAQSDVELTNRPGLDEDALAKIVGEHDGLIVRSAATVSANVLEHPGRLKIIARAGVGVDNIDLDAATAAGILVINTAEANTITTAEHAFGLLLALARHIGQAHVTMADGRWDRNRFQGTQLSGKTLGVVGLGRIGQAVAQRALAFDMNVVGFDPFINAPTTMDGKVKLFRSFVEMLPNVDMLTFHVPLTDDTRGILSDASFAQCNPGMLAVNASRGGVIDEDALLRALDNGQCGGAALDVYATEPLPADSPLRKHPKLLVTPHLGASTVEAQRAVSIDAADSLLKYLRGQGISGAVNAPGLRLDLDPVQAGFVDLASRMARLISPMVTRGFASVTFEVTGEQPAAVAGTIERVALIGLLQGHMNTPLNMINVRHAAEQRGIKLRTIIDEKGQRRGEQVIIEIAGEATHGTPPRRIVGGVDDSMHPRVREINGYHMDMVPAGAMVIVQNDDQPGIIGIVGTEFGNAGVNIADMVISRRHRDAMMVLKVDNDPPADLLDKLRAHDSINRAIILKLPAVHG